MAAENDFVPFATGVGANVLTQTAYLANSQTTAGQQPGVASSALNNKALRQATSIAAAFAQYMANVTGSDVLDNGNQSELLTTIAACFGNTPPNISFLTSSSGNYSVPAGTTYLKIRMAAAGGGGSGSGSGGGSGLSGGSSSFGSSVLSATGGGGGTFAGSGGSPGVGTLSGGAVGLISQLGLGGPSTYTGTAAGNTASGGMGGANPFAGAGAGGQLSTAGFAAGANTGAGGGGAGMDQVSGEYSGSGGGPGGYIEAIISGAALTAMGSLIAYTVGVGGAGGTAGSNGYVGGAGANGGIYVEAY